MMRHTISNKLFTALSFSMTLPFLEIRKLWEAIGAEKQRQSWLAVVSAAT